MGSHCGVFSTWLQTPEYWSPKCADLLRSDHWQYNIIKRCDSDREHPQLLWGFDWDLTYQTKGCWSIVILIWFCLNYQSTARVMVRGWSTIGRPFEDRIWLLKIKVFIRLVTWCVWELKLFKNNLKWQLNNFWQFFSLSIYRLHMVRQASGIIRTVGNRCSFKLDKDRNLAMGYLNKTETPLSSVTHSGRFCSCWASRKISEAVTIHCSHYILLPQIQK